MYFSYSPYKNNDFHSYSIKKLSTFFNSVLCYLCLHVDKLRLCDKKIDKFSFHKNGAGIGENPYQVRYGSLKWVKFEFEKKNYKSIVTSMSLHVCVWEKLSKVG